MSPPIAYGSVLCPDGAALSALVPASPEVVLDLGALARERADELVDLLDRPNLDALLAAGPGRWRRVHEVVTGWADDPRTLSHYGRPAASATTQMPFTVADYVDFFSSREHAENLGRILRPGQPALQPNWLSLPVGYHGRAGTVVASGTPVIRPSGQLPAGDSSVFGPTRKLDVEVEVGFVVGGEHAPGIPLPTSSFEEAVFGVVLINDWSARDIQAFEYVPLGPMLAKSFATSISAWVYPLAAFVAARVTPPARERPLHAYLDSSEPWGLDIDLQLSLNGTAVSEPRFRDMYWTPDQQLAHMTVNGARARAGDLFGSGTVSSSDPGGYGSLIELTHNGQDPLALDDGSIRTFLEDGDEVVISATAPAVGGGRFTLGEVRGVVLPARETVEEQS